LLAWLGRLEVFALESLVAGRAVLLVFGGAIVLDQELGWVGWLFAGQGRAGQGRARRIRRRGYIVNS
jgi:hypothetical protein